VSTMNYADVRKVASAEREAFQADRASRRWRAIWRTHFYAGIFSVPFLVMMALTGLVILYTQPIRSLTQDHLRHVKVVGASQPLEAQRTAVLAAFADGKITTIVTPANETTATVFGLEDGREAFVNPYTAQVLGSDNKADDVVGLANRLHGFFNNDNVKVPLPSVSGLIGDGPIIQRYALSDLLLEVFAGWGLVLGSSGIYLWWPRRTRASNGGRTKPLLVPRVAKRGRARWRDLHSIPGLVLSIGLAFVLVSGMPWAAYWGPNFTAVANKISPNKWVDTPNSSVAKLGDLDRLGGQINWNTGNAVLPNSPASQTASTIALDTVVAAATQERMKPGYSISLPIDKTDDVGNPTFGSFTVANSWPRKTSESKTVYLDQFTGKTISTMNANGYGSVSRAADTLVSTHMGTEFGLVTRIVMTLICLLTLWSVASALVMYGKRRRPGTAGLPRRPRNLKMANRMIAISVVLGIVYPLWGVTALVVLGVDRFVIRRIPKTRVAFGQR
jgi:uncharacterized iron-regulated membrane protein